MTEELKQKLILLANKYETPSFCNSDPSQFLRWYNLEQSGAASVECASFIAAMLAFGNRKQFIPKIQQILEMADQWCKTNDYNEGGVAQWCLAGAPGFPTGEKKFYRFYSYDDMHKLFSDYAQVLNSAPTLGDYIKIKYEGGEANKFAGLPLDQIISQSFPNASIVPKGQTSANKRIHLFLRWMVRQNSPVDLGIWNWASPADLLIPLDVHVMEEGIKLGLLSANAKASRKTAEELSAKLSQVFPGDPCRGDYALFGLGVDV